MTDTADRIVMRQAEIAYRSQFHISSGEPREHEQRQIRKIATALSSHGLRELLYKSARLIEASKRVYETERNQSGVALTYLHVQQRIDAHQNLYAAANENQKVLAALLGEGENKQI